MSQGTDIAGSLSRYHRFPGVSIHATTHTRSRASGWIVCLSASLALLSTPRTVVGQSATPPTHDHDRLRESARFVIIWDRHEATTQEEIEDFAVRVDELFERIADVVGAENTPREKLVLVLDGSGRRTDGSVREPHVDSSGRIFVYRYSDRFADYRLELAHEIVHAFRRLTGERYTGFLEEGFAAVVAAEVDPLDGQGFPTYGFRLDIVAGHIVAGEEYIPVERLRHEHSRLNLRCQLQSYAVRSSFFAYLRRRFGMEGLVALAYEQVVGDPFEAILAQPFPQLVSAWRADLLRRYRAIARADEEARRHRVETPIRYKPICRPGDGL